MRGRKEKKEMVGRQKLLESLFSLIFYFLADESFEFHRLRNKSRADGKPLERETRPKGQKRVC